jgi:hypothetical protein
VLDLPFCLSSEKGCVIEQVRALPGDAPGRFKVIRTAGKGPIPVCGGRDGLS